MTRIKRGEILLLEVVFSSGLGTKLRPGMVLSSNEYNKNRGEIIVAAITSNLNRLHEGDTDIKHWEKSGLKAPSLATAILQTVKKDRIKKRLGQISPSDFKEIQTNISKVLGFSF